MNIKFSILLSSFYLIVFVNANRSRVEHNGLDKDRTNKNSNSIFIDKLFLKYSNNESYMSVESIFALFVNLFY